MLLQTSIQLYLILLLCIINSSSWLSHVPAQAGAVDVFGGEKAFFTVPQMSPEADYRQDVCDRYRAFRNGTFELKDSLKGMKLNVLMGAYNGSYFNYDDENGIDASYPGIAAILMDELAQRAGFTWRSSFGVFGDPRGGEFNETWTGVLTWGVENYDLNVDWWATNMERLNLGVAYTKPWYDSSIILVGKKGPEEIIDEEIEWNDFWNWTKPFTVEVWIATFATIFVSGLAYMLMEWLNGERDGRKPWVWFSDNLYLSAINATQAYEYGTPNSVAGKIFGVSMASWALIMAATYTANLASLLVDRRAVTLNIETIEKASVFGYQICTVAGTNANTYIEEAYPWAKLRPAATLESMYDDLNSGKCAFAADVVQSWLGNKHKRKYNKNCNLEWVGGKRVVVSNRAGFATKADAGFKCTGLIRDVINFYMEEMIVDGFLDDAWLIENRRNQDIDCDNIEAQELEEFNAVEAGSDTTGQRNLLTQNHCERAYHPTRRRRLKASRSSAVSTAVLADGAGGDDEGTYQMTLEAMMGPFFIHWVLMALSLLIAIWKKLYEARAVPVIFENKKLDAFESERSNPFGFCKIMRGRLNEDLEVVSTDDGAADRSLQYQIEELQCSFGKSEAARVTENRTLQGKMDMIIQENQTLQEKMDVMIKENEHLRAQLVMLIGQIQRDEHDTMIRHA